MAMHWYNVDGTVSETQLPYPASTQTAALQDSPTLCLMSSGIKAIPKNSSSEFLGYQVIKYVLLTISIM